MNDINKQKNLGPRARLLGLEWKDPKPKIKKKKVPLKSKPKKIKIMINKHDPRTKSQAYFKIENIDFNIEAKKSYIVDVNKLKEIMDILHSENEIDPNFPDYTKLPKIITYEVEYLDEE